MGAAQSSSKEDLEHEAWEKNLQKHYDGRWHWSPGLRFRRPPKLTPEQLRDRMIELEHEDPVIRKRRYLNPNGDDEHEKFPDLDTYYSTTKEFPRRLVVQATKDAQKDTRPRHWGQTQIDGRTPFIIRLSELCLNPLNLERYESGWVDPSEDDPDSTLEKKSMPRRVWIVCLRIIHHVLSIFFTLTLAWIIQVLLSVDIITKPWSGEGSSDKYEDYDNVQWDWPKHAINILDQSPGNTRPQSSLARLLTPRRLVVWDTDKEEWVAKETTQLRDKNTGMLQPYIFLSFSRGNYSAGDDILRPFFHKIAGSILERENANRDPKEEPVKAFWVDTDCVSHENKLDEARDINSICDAVRCARRVYILLPSDSAEDKKIWGKRVWTLPEVLLAAEKIRYCITPEWKLPSVGNKSTDTVFYDVSLSDMYNSFWDAFDPISTATTTESNGERPEDAISHLIDHYTNRTKLSELQLFTFAVQAMAKLVTGDVEGYTTTSMAYAAMGLLSYRITPDEEDDTFQAIARLSLVNDSNEMLERLVCLWPSYRSTIPSKSSIQGEERYAVAGSEALLRNIADQDQYSVHLWDIEPSCEVVGIGSDKYTPTVILDRCRGIPIRWKSFPEVQYVQNFTSLRANISQFIVWMGAWFLLAGFNLFATVISLAFAGVNGGTTLNIDQYMYGILLYVGVAWIISCFSPRAVRYLCSGGSSGLSCHMVGFEGTMTLREIEKAIYGNFNDRLSYAPSSTIFSQSLRHPKIRMGVEPRDKYGDPLGRDHWEQERKVHGIPDTHRLFTIVDTGDMTVSVIAAERPPVVALICGREGGMLRALLCSWRFDKNCLYRECVVRMRSSIEDQATPNDWLKVSLASQSDVSRTRLRYAQQEKASRFAPSPPPPTPPQKDTVQRVVTEIPSRSY
ncbi:hypothetical protein N7520_000554 [Penicillium odoratum]|uniref:uncharacterized protein n=1 Tax=Penicillium odoratum TaxID=1167516 RepID=UPI002547E00B|nr:uncharacterized protein N7520_000554 [Penicillium odoratum]KAJ5777308.1 hypothetical protein N7520_000554 [Penicillium odoratum]